VVQGRVVATGCKEDIMIIRDLLTSHGVEIKPFPQVRGKIKSLMQQLALVNPDGKRELTAEGSIYSGWSITVTGEDIMTSQIVTKTSKIINHAYSEGRHLVTLDPDLGVEFEMGSSKATLSPPKGSGGEKVEAVVGFHVYPALQQVLSVGDVEKDSVLNEIDDFYYGYKFEIWDKDTLLAQQRVHEYIAASHTFILKGALAPTGAPGSTDIKSGATFCVYPDQLLPQLRDSVTPKDIVRGRGAGA